MKKRKISTTIAASLLLLAPNYSSAFKPNSGYAAGSITDYDSNKLPQNHRGITDYAIRKITDYKFSNEVIDAIKDADTSVDDYFGGSIDIPKAHCDDELLADCSQRIKDIQGKVVAALISPNPNYESARTLTGQALHTVQDFYAHSNYSHLYLTGKRTTIAPVEIGFSPEEIKGSGSVDTDSNKTCEWSFGYINNAPRDPREYGNRGNTTITSGYFKILDAPEFKCKHGGNGTGINKDYPTNLDFVAARDLAVQATTNFMETIFTRVKNEIKSGRLPDDVLKEYAGEKPHVSLGFIIDTTGSMGDTITGIKQAMSKIVDNYGSFFEVSIMPYGDPNIGDILTAKSIPDMQSNINTVTLGVPDDGGDTPEQATLALKKMIDKAGQGSAIFLYTDADTHQAELADEIIVSAKAKNITITFFSSDGYTVPAYEKIAQATGGSVFPYEHTVIAAANTFTQIQPNFLGNLQETIKFEQGMTLPNPAPLLKKSASLKTTTASAPNVQLFRSSTGNSAYHIMPIPKYNSVLKSAKTLSTALTEHVINVDSSATSLLVSVRMSPLGNIMLIRPDDTQVLASDANVTINTSSVGQTILVDNPMVGQWRFKAESDAKYELSVKMNSDFRFISFSFAEERGRPEHTGLFPIEGQPLVTEKQYFTLVLAGSVNTSDLVLSALDGRELGRVELTDPTIEGDSRKYIGEITLPTEDFRVSIKGKDNNDNDYERLYPNVYLGQSVKVVPFFVEPYAPINKTFKTNFIIENHGLADNFTVSATDSLGYPVAVTPATVAIKAKNKAKVEVTVNIPATAELNSNLNVVLTAQSQTNAKSANTAISNFTLKNIKLGDIDKDNDVDNSDLTYITSAMNSIATASNDPRDLNGDKKINALDTRKLVLLCTRPRCATK